MGNTPAYQFTGKDEETINLSGVIYPEITGYQNSSVIPYGYKMTLRTIEGTGKIYGLVIIKDVQETRSNFFHNGGTRRITFSVSLIITEDTTKKLLVLRSGIVKSWGVSFYEFYALNTEQYTRHNNYPHAIYRITVNDIDISSTLASRLVGLSLQDNRGMVADSVDLTLDDSDNALEIPSVGAEMKVWLGWSDTGLMYKGSYLVTGGSHSGAPDVREYRLKVPTLQKHFVKSESDRSTNRP